MLTVAHSTNTNEEQTTTVDDIYISSNSDKLWATQDIEGRKRLECASNGEKWIRTARQECNIAVDFGLVLSVKRLNQDRDPDPGLQFPPCSRLHSKLVLTIPRVLAVASQLPSDEVPFVRPTEYTGEPSPR